MRLVSLWLYRALAVLFLLGVVIEFFFAGVGVFRTQLEATTAGTMLTKSGFERNFHLHLLLGDSLFGLSLLLIVAATLARVGRRDILNTVGLFALLAVQATFAFTGSADLRALHPTLALLVLGAAVHLALHAVRTQQHPALLAEEGQVKLAS